jgi:hypothetical protein
VPPVEAHSALVVRDDVQERHLTAVLVLRPGHNLPGPGPVPRGTRFQFTT